MNLLAFSLLDVKVGTFSAPFFMPHRGGALRALADLVQDRNTTVARHPGDFHLYVIGTFDDQTGRMISTEVESLGTAAQFVQQVELPLLKAAE